MLGGRSLCDSEWGRVLASQVAELSLSSSRTPPCHKRYDRSARRVAGLAANERSGSRAASEHLSSGPVRDRSTTTSGSAAQSIPAGGRYAGSLQISTCTLHRALGVSGDMFGAMLIEARVDLAVRRSKSPCSSA